MEGPDSIAAIFAEGVTGSNGGFIPPPDYWPKLREICDRYNILLVADEVFSGFGRTGEWFAVDHWKVVPDMITMAKGVTSGYAPLGVLGVRQSLAGASIMRFYGGLAAMLILFPVPLLSPQSKHTKRTNSSTMQSTKVNT